MISSMVLSWWMDAIHLVFLNDHKLLFHDGWIWIITWSVKEGTIYCNGLLCFCLRYCPDDFGGDSKNLKIYFWRFFRLDSFFAFKPIVLILYAILVPLPFSGDMVPII